LKPTTLDLIGQIADLKDTDYKNTLAISVLIELLMERQLFRREEFAQKCREVETATLSELIQKRRSPL
jgi:hypothetical protein